MTPDFGIYQRVKAVLAGTSAITSFPVHADNIRPTDDLQEPKPGALITFGWDDYALDLKTLKASGVFTVNVESEVSKPKAQELASLVRAALTARSITGDRSVTVVGFFKERSGTTDAGTSPSGRFAVALSYDVRAIKV
jgi:hypothetical protein